MKDKLFKVTLGTWSEETGDCYNISCFTGIAKDAGSVIGESSLYADEEERNKREGMETFIESIEFISEIDAGCNLQHKK